MAQQPLISSTTSAPDAAESQQDRWCREVSRQPFEQFLRGHAHYRRLKPEHRQLLEPPVAPLLKHKSPEQLAWVTLMLDLEGTLLMCRQLPDSGDDWTGWEAMQSHPSADVILLLPDAPGSFRRNRYAVYKRPGLDNFLAGLAGLPLECVAFSSATLELARSLVVQLDRDGVIASVLARKACTWAGSSSGGQHHPSLMLSGRPLLFKDINAVGRDPARTVLVDDWPLGCANQENLLPVPRFREGTAEWRLQKQQKLAPSEAAELPLVRLLEVLKQLAEYTGDVRDFLSRSSCVAAYRAAMQPAG